MFDVVRDQLQYLKGELIKFKYLFLVRFIILIILYFTQNIIVLVLAVLFQLFYFTLFNKTKLSAVSLISLFISLLLIALLYVNAYYGILIYGLFLVVSLGYSFYESRGLFLMEMKRVERLIWGKPLDEFTKDSPRPKIKWRLHKKS